MMYRGVSLSLAAAVTLAAAPVQTVTGRAMASAGDMVTIGENAIRLYGIAAPVTGETCQTRYGVGYDCFRRSTEILQALIGEGEATCVVTNTDRTGQKIGVCRVGGTDLGAAMVARGWAFAYRRLTPAYVGSEAFAESHRLGMWAGKIETPWQWRSRQLIDKAK